jgi:AcrR family transcriptional regulator
VSKLKKNAKQKILEAAMEVFGEQGFRAATVREICKKAGVNIALVNYHFKSKKLLYFELFNAISADIDGRYPMEKFVKPDMTKEQKLRGLVEVLICRFFGPDGLTSSKARLRLVNREMLEPSDIMEEIILHKMNEYVSNAENLFYEFLGEDTPKDKINMIIISLVAQCSYPMFSTELLKKSKLINKPMPEFCKELTEHVYEFTIKAVESMRSK